MGGGCHRGEHERRAHLALSCRQWPVVSGACRRGHAARRGRAAGKYTKRLAGAATGYPLAGRRARLGPGCDGGDAMPARSGWELTPRQSLEIECARRGTVQVVAGCVALLQRQDVDDDFLLALSGPAGYVGLDDGPAQRNQYWRRVWGARGLLYAWADEAEGAVVAALDDEHWRV